MKVLIIHPGKMPTGPSDIACFSDVWTYYLSRELKKHIVTDIVPIPTLPEGKLIDWFKNDLKVEGYRAVIATGLRYFSTVPRVIGDDLRQRLGRDGFLCQIYDGSRLDNDPVDITFTFKDDSAKYPFDSGANRYVRHHSYNAHIGWAADQDLNRPRQDSKILRILVDHTNYGDNPVDRTKEILKDIKEFIDKKTWMRRWEGVSVRRFDSGRVVDVDFDRINEIERYDRRSIPFEEICAEHCQAHVFCVTHPESVGLVVLETAMAGALIVTPSGFIPDDRLATVRYTDYEERINWKKVLSLIDPQASRVKALANSWEQVAKQIRAKLRIRSRIRNLDD